MASRSTPGRGVSRRKFLIGTGAATAGIALASCGSPESAGTGGGTAAGSDSTLIVYDGGGVWGEAQRKAFYEPFAEETGVRVVPSPAPRPAELAAQIRAGRPGMDLIDVPANDLQSYINDDLIQPLDYSKWSDKTLRDAFDPVPAHEYGAPCIFFVTHLIWDAAKVGGDLSSWADVWDTRRFPGPRTLPVGSFPSGGLYEIALLADGVAPADLYPLDMDRAFAKLDEIRPHILKFWESGAESVQLQVDGQVSVNAVWNGRSQGIREEGIEISSTFNQALLQHDYWAIPKGTRNYDLALQLIEFASQPERQAALAELIPYAPTIPAAFDHISDERATILPTHADHIDSVISQSPEFWGADSGNGTPWNLRIGELWQEWLAKG